MCTGHCTTRMIKTPSSVSVTPIWRIGILVNMILYGVMTVIVSNNASGIHQLTASHQKWLPWACVAGLLTTFVCMAGAFDRHAKALWASYILFNIALLWTETLMLASSMTPTQEKPDKTSVRYSAIAGSVFDLLVFMSSWRPRGAVSTVKLHLGETPAHVLPLRSGERWSSCGMTRRGTGAICAGGCAVCQSRSICACTQAATPAHISVGRCRRD
jgi:hypothetical protein